MKKPDQNDLKLRLSTQTVRELSRHAISAAAGGTFPRSWSCTPSSRICGAPDGQ